MLDKIKEIIIEQLNLQASAQLVHLHLLHINNCFGNPGQFYCTDNRLAIYTNLSADSITKAKRILKNCGLIDFITDKKNPRKGTLYILPCQRCNQQCNQQGKKQGNQQGNSIGVLSNTLRIKEKDIEKDSINTDTTITRTREKTACSEEVAKAWLMAEGEYPHGYTDQWLLLLEQEYTAEKLVDAIKAAVAGNHEARITINFVRAILKKQKSVGEKDDGGRKASGVVSEEWENARPAWLDG